VSGDPPFAGVGLAGALVTCGWYLVQNTVRYGDPLARKATEKYLQATGGLGTRFGRPYLISNPLNLVVVRVPQEIFHAFWYGTGASTVRWSQWISLLFWLVLVASIAGLIGRRKSPAVLVPLIAISLAAFLSVWIVAFQTFTYSARYSLVGIAAIAGLAALGTQWWRLPVRFALPLMGLIGTVVSIQVDVFAVHWN
jgi:hypothetical protein